MGIGKILLALIFGLVAITVALNWSMIFSDSGGNFLPKTKEDFMTIALYYCTSVLGIVSSIIYRNLPDGKQVTLRKIKASLTASDSIRALLVSPIVFGVTVAGFGEDTNFIMTLLFSYQNGFFWDNVLRKTKDAGGLLEGEPAQSA